MVEFYLLTVPRFPFRKKEHKSYFGKNRTHDFRTSRCAAYLLDHSGYNHNVQEGTIIRAKTLDGIHGHHIYSRIWINLIRLPTLLVVS